MLIAYHSSQQVTTPLRRTYRHHDGNSQSIGSTAHDAVLAVNVHVSALVSSAYANQTKLRYQLENLSLG
jgi:hypothetical protein